ncbi:O-antigen ligase family protein [Calothrix sp. CCY 0018]|uniref:O-antigen ligase family protein n=1 Tax=Calothrix sp. CCY 0018 TaxID=3103864 RepID=UPI0039C6862C
MSDTTFSTQTFTKYGFKLGNLSLAEKVIYWTIILTPLWWILGIQTILYPTVAAFLLVVRFKFDKIIKGSLPICNWAWLGMILVALWTNIIGLESIGFQILKTAATLFTLFKGYFLIFACLTLPFWHRIRVKVITRAVSWMSASYLVILTIQFLILFAIGPQKSFLPPLARLIPGDKLSLMIKFAVIQPFFGIPLPRTDLYTADPPILGVCALLCFFICLEESNRSLRKVSLIGCLAALLVSQSRLAWVCFPLVCSIIYCFRSGLARQAYLWVISLLTLFAAVLSLSLKDLIALPLTTFNNARADSSKDREYVVNATIDAWKKSPFVGWGFMEKTVSWGNGAFEMPLGTFSSYAQVLYIHGIFGFIIFILALVSTLCSFWQPAMFGNIICQRAFACLVALYLLLHATNLSWMAIYFWFFFIWLGAILSEVQQLNVTEWEELSNRF